MKPARHALTVVEMGTGEVAWRDMVSIRIEGMKGGTSYGKALMRDVMPSTPESVRRLYQS